MSPGLYFNSYHMIRTGLLMKLKNILFSFFRNKNKALLISVLISWTYITNITGVFWLTFPRKIERSSKLFFY